MPSNWKPEPKTKEILDTALAHIKSVPYKVSLRWLFYRLLQQGLYNKKEDYHNQFKSTVSRARKEFYDGWHPNILQDDTRNIIWKGIGADNKNNWIENLKCNLDKISTQDYFVMICFEARAMADQFNHYTKNIPLAPFGGDASIPYKWNIAKEIEWAAETYGKPIKILYFGDCDKKGKKIKTAAFKDIQAWCETEFELIYCGLTPEQAKELQLPDNPDKPGDFQWESLTDEQAKELIFRSVAQFQKLENYVVVEEEEKNILDWAKNRLGEIEHD